MLNRVIAKIEQQQKGLEDRPAYYVGEHLKAILKGSSARCCEIVLKDLDVKEMSISECEKVIKKYADEHKKGNIGFVPPDVAEGIIKKFYGIGDADNQEGAKPVFVDLSDFI